MLTYYSAKDYLRIIKSLNPDLYHKIKYETPDTQRYIGNIYLNTQFGGSEEEDSNILILNRANTEIKNIVQRISENVRLVRKELDFTKEENQELKKQLAEIGNQTVNLEVNKCDTDSINKHINTLLLTKTQLKKFINTVDDMMAKKLEIPENIKNGIGEYIKLDNKLGMFEQRSGVITQDTVNCDNYDQIKEKLKEFIEPKLFQRILDDFEDLSGTVRVFVRILNRSSFEPALQYSGSQTFNFSVAENTFSKNTKVLKGPITETCETPLPDTNTCLSLASVTSNGKYVQRTKFPCVKDSTKLIDFKWRYGPFFSVFENVNNQQVYDGVDGGMGVSSILQQINSGTNAVVFSYGLSGSGKTHSILGSPTEDGMIQLLFKNVTNVTKVTMDTYELYGKIDLLDTRTTSSYNISKKIIDYGSITITNPNAVATKIEEVNIIRRKEQRIKYTTNNPVSSRGHLFIKLNFVLNDGKKSSVTFIDSAGIEDPLIIARSFLHVDETNVKKLSQNTVTKLLTDFAFIKPFTKSDIKIVIFSNKILDAFIKQYSPKHPSWARFIRSGTVTHITRGITIDEGFTALSLFNVTAKNLEDKKDMNKMMKFLFLYSLRFEIIKDDTKYKELFGSLLSSNVNIPNVVKYIWDMFTEGLFINESLNHLKLFTQKNIGKQPNFKTINISDFRQQDGKNGYLPEKFITIPKFDESKNISEMNKSADTIDMIELLKFLTDNTNSKRKTKYIMLMNIRTDLDEPVCRGAKQTLEYANSVKST